MRFATARIVLIALAGSVPVTTLLAADNISRDAPVSAMIFGPANPLLADGAAALEAGRVEDGLKLTLAGLQLPNAAHDAAAGHANACAGYVMQKRFDDALPHCNKAIELDAQNWRALNNRAAVHVGKGSLELALLDVLSGLAIAPESSTLKLSLRIVQDHQRVMRDRRRKAVQA